MEYNWWLERISNSCLYSELGSPILPFPFVEFPTDPGINTSMSLTYLQAVLIFFQNAHCITVGRSFPARSRVGASPDP